MPKNIIGYHPKNGGISHVLWYAGMTTTRTMIATMAGGDDDKDEDNNALKKRNIKVTDPILVRRRIRV